MKAPSFRGKPGETHVIWQRSGAQNSGAHKRFDEDALRRWCRKFDVDFETGKRVDHERGDEPREQYRCVFTWSEQASEAFDIDGEHWDIQTQETPQTFIEIDNKGVVRVKGWNSEHVLDVSELWYDGPKLVLKAAEFDGTKQLDVRKLTSKPEE